MVAETRDPMQMRNAPPGYNGVLSASGYGSRFVRVASVGFGFTVIASEDEARSSRAYYPLQRSTADFTVAFLCKDYADRNSLSAWLRKYGIAVTAGAVRCGLMQVSIPGRNFLMAGIPATGMTYGATKGEIAIVMPVTFLAARDVRDRSDSAAASASVYVAASDSLAAYYYPSGTQLSGSGLDGTLFDAAVGDASYTFDQTIPDNTTDPAGDVKSPIGRA